MSWLDVMLVAFLALALLSGYRRGATLQTIALLGLAAGVVLGALLAPRVASIASSPSGAIALAMGAVVIGAAVGNTLGWVLGSRLRPRDRGSPLRRVDAVGGSVISALALLLVTWFLTLNLANGPFPELARGIRGSRIVRVLDSQLPTPPSIVGELERVLALLGFPDVFVGLPPQPADAVDPPRGADARAATRAADDSTVQIFGRGCFQGFLSQGSGFAVADGYIVTNAHVVAGTDEQWIGESDGETAATVVVFDPDLDIAVLYAPELQADPLRLLRGEVGRGAGGAILGYPGGGPLKAEAAAVRQVIEPVGRDIYGDDEVRRRVYEVQASIRRGNSGGPFVLANGRVAGVVFAASVVADEVGYAIVSTQVLPSVREAREVQEAVGTGSCTG